MDRDVTDKVLSDVHVFTPHSVVDSRRDGTICVSRFYFSLPTDESDVEKTSKSASERLALSNDDENIVYDEDGDIVVNRKQHREEKLVLTIEHLMETRLEDVGLQVWQGCLLMCDLVLHLRHKFKDKKVLDLGAGVGLTSAVTGLFAKCVIVTDMCDSILEMAERNIDINKSVVGDKCSFRVRELDWYKPLLAFDSDGTKQGRKYKLNEEDLKSFESIDILLAAEVIYDQDLTDAFFSMVKRLMTKPPQKTLFISLERRMVFTVDDLDVVSPAYDHFRDKLSELESWSDEDVKFSCTQIPCDFPCYFVYDRHKYLELWEVVSKWPS